MVPPGGPAAAPSGLETPRPLQLVQRPCPTPHPLPPRPGRPSISLPSPASSDQDGDRADVLLMVGEYVYDLLSDRHLNIQPKERLTTTFVLRPPRVGTRDRAEIDQPGGLQWHREVLHLKANHCSLPAGRVKSPVHPPAAQRVSSRRDRASVSLDRWRLGKALSEEKPLIDLVD